MGRLYKAFRIMNYNNRPVLKVELVESTPDTVTFYTDYPVERITISRQEFGKYFREWG